LYRRNLQNEFITSRKSPIFATIENVDPNPSMINIVVRKRQQSILQKEERSENSCSIEC